MAQRWEIESWVNPSAWDDPAEAAQVVDEIEALRTDDEQAWIEVVARHDVERVQRRLDAAEAERAAAVEERSRLLRGLHSDNGIPVYRLAQWCGISHQQARRVVKGG